ncbi:hypothetical protein [Arthrobacter sp. ZGTC131]|nr:hypothetical protein [Arthrobacter sp. ZGTC131]
MTMRPFCPGQLTAPTSWQHARSAALGLADPILARRIQPSYGPT